MAHPLKPDWISQEQWDRLLQIWEATQAQAARRSYPPRPILLRVLPASPTTVQRPIT